MCVVASCVFRLLCVFFAVVTSISGLMTTSGLVGVENSATSGGGRRFLSFDLVRCVRLGKSSIQSAEEIPSLPPLLLSLWRLLQRLPSSCVLSGPLTSFAFLTVRRGCCKWWV